MPLNDFAPAAAGNVDPGKVYLIKGSTLKELLVRVECNLSQFDVEEGPLKRIYTLKNSGSGSGGSASGTAGLSFNILIKDVGVYASYDPGTGVTHTQILENFEPLKLCVRHGLITNDESNDDGFDDLYTYSLIGRISGTDGTDSGDMRYAPGAAPF